MKIKELWIWIGIIAVTFATLWGLIALVNNSPASSTPQVETPKAVSSRDITLGIASNAKVTLIEYADFQCPACSVLAPFVKQLNKEFGNNLLIAYRFFPLNAHQNAMPSAQAAFAAYKQNKFWEMSELIYQNQDSWTNAGNAQQIFTDYAKKLNLNIDKFTSNYNEESTKKFINDETKEGLSIGITYTPSFFVNGKLIQNPQNYEEFKQIIQNTLNSK